jgi:outer membrane protein TolC
MALRNNKQMSVAKVKQDVAANTRKSARTKYLPHVNALGGYMWMSKEISILNNDQKDALSHLGTNAGATLSSSLTSAISQLPAASQMNIAQDLSQFVGTLDQTGAGLVNSLRTDTHNMFAGAVMVTQPVFMGGAITAANKIADINEEMAANTLETKRQGTLYNIDHAYWQVVSLHHKKVLAESYVGLVRKLMGDVQKMIDKGVATKGDGLSVGVRVNEAEIALMEAEDGLALSKMLLCQLCGLPVDEEIVLADENSESLPTALSVPDAQNYDNRPELKLLQNTVDLSRQTTNVLKAGNLPQVLLTGGYAVTNPNTFNGFEKKFGGFWNVGVLVRIPVWNWGDVKYKVRASKGATTMANLELAEARETIELQVNQSRFRVNEAYKKLEMAQANVANADENLRMANLGFKEGTVSFTTVMEAQTAWQLAQTKKIDAEIGVRLRQVELQKALGTLTAN